uniref:General transcription factor IIF subunit 2 n=1 Tax=Meleagris gallopavo TaxID=9103 RepID=A0A803YLR3_MELGA
MSEKGELDLTGAKQNTGMWLVKVPKYLSQQWSKASGRGEVGKLRIAKNQGRTEVSFTLNEELASISDIGGKPASVSAPREHPFLLQSVGGQTLTVFTESSTGKLELLLVVTVLVCMISMIWMLVLKLDKVIILNTAAVRLLFFFLLNTSCLAYLKYGSGTIYVIDLDVQGNTS